MKNINQLLIITLILFIYIHYKEDIYENYEGTISKETCVQRILNHECIDPEKKEKLNRDCGEFQIPISTGISNVSCDDEVLVDTLRCTKMISDGACDCSYGRRQIQGICDVDPVNISCPKEMTRKDEIILEKINTLKEESQKCKDVEIKEKKLARYAFQLKNIILKGGLIKDDTNLIYIVIPLVILGGGIAFFFYNKKK
tara:strand:+ start:842 stop:1438 length:597 start_codon:yes stop_codon:yes gene_type:complete